MDSFPWSCTAASSLSSPAGNQAEVGKWNKHSHVIEKRAGINTLWLPLPVVFSSEPSGLPCHPDHLEKLPGLLEKSPICRWQTWPSLEGFCTHAADEIALSRSDLLPFSHSLPRQTDSPAQAASSPATATAVTCSRLKGRASRETRPTLVSRPRWPVCAAAARRPTWWPRSAWSACSWSSSSSSSSAGPPSLWSMPGRPSTGARPTAWPARPSPSFTCCPTPRPASTPSFTASWTSASARGCSPRSPAAAAWGGAAAWGDQPGRPKGTRADLERGRRRPSRTAIRRQAGAARASPTPASVHQRGASWPKLDRDVCLCVSVCVCV